MKVRISNSPWPLKVVMRNLCYQLIFFACSASFASTPSWYEQTSFACSDPLNLTAALTQSSWFTKTVNLKSVAINQGLIYAIVSKSDFARYSSAVDHSESMEEIALSPQRADSMRQILKISQQNAKVPLLAAAVTAIPSYFTTWTGGVVLDQVFGLIFSNLDEISVAADTLRNFVASGGILKSVVTAGTKDNSEYLVYSYVYTVNVGNESRTFLLSSCVYAAKLTFKEIDTVGTLNNKHLVSLGGDMWRVFDVDEGKFDPGDWVETYRDREFIYLENSSSGNIIDKWRVSVHGGKWQVQLQDGTWGTLYLATVNF
jgi:hypothetical protein